MVGGDGHHVGRGVHRDAGDIPLVSGGGRVGRGLGGRRRYRRGLRLRGTGGGEDSGKGIVVPVHGGAQLLRDKAQGDHGALAALPLNHAGGHATGQLHGLTIDQCGGRAQGEYDGALLPQEDDLTGFRHPGYRGTQPFRDQADGYQRAAVLSHRVLHQGGYIVRCQRRAVQRQADPVGLGQFTITLGSLVVEVDGEGPRGTGRPGGQQPRQQGEGEQEGNGFFHGRTPRR